MVGTRPEAIKMGPVAAALRARGHDPLLILTGQQTVDLAAHGLDKLDRLTLDCPGLPDPDAHVQAVARALRPMLSPRPRLLLVQGDTSSAMGAAHAAFAAKVAVGHVEAGLRTHDRRQPWPEEGYRIAIDARSDLLFAPAQCAADNLVAEGVPGEIHVTGNSGIDALCRVAKLLPARSVRDAAAAHLLVTCHRRESWAEGLSSIAAALVEIARSGRARIDFILHPNGHVAARMRHLLGGVPEIDLVAPCSHAELVRRMSYTDLILSDSGGIQEEAPALGTPLLVLRDKTERPEVIASGNARLVGTQAVRIVSEVARLLDDPLALAAMSRRSFPYGTGDAGVKIAAAVDGWLQRSELRDAG